MSGIKETAFVSTGLSAPLWVQYMTQIATPVIGFLIALCTLAYAFFRALDYFHKWRDNWAERKLKEREMFGLNKRREND